MIRLEKYSEFHTLALPVLIWPDEKKLWAAGSFLGFELYQADIAGHYSQQLSPDLDSNALSLSPDQQWVAIYNQCELQLFNALNQTQVAAYEYLPPKNLSLAEAEIEKSRCSFYPNLRAHWSPDSEYLAFARNHNNVVIVERSTGLQIQEFGYDDFQTMIKFNDSAVGFSLDSRVSMAFHPDGKQLAFAYHNWNMGGFGEHWIGLWDWRSKTLLQTKQILFCGGNIESLDFSADGSELIVSAREDDIFEFDHAVYILDSQTLEEKRRIVLDQYQYFSASLDPSRQYIATLLINWNPPENRRYFPKGYFLAIWDLASTQKIFEQDMTEYEQHNLAWSPDGNYLVTGVYSEGRSSKGKPNLIVWKVNGLYSSQASA
jgi:WD40 repeat protein